MASERSPLDPLLAARDEQGRLRYDPRTAEDFLSACLLAGPPDDAPLGPALEAMLLRFLDRVRIPPGADRGEIEERVRDYFVDHPLPRALVNGVAALDRAWLTEEARETVALLEAAASGIGGGLANTTAPPADGPGGALGYFVAQRDASGDDR